jgi:hypothetical protein
MTRALCISGEISVHIPGFPYNLFTVSCGDIDLKKPLLPLGTSCPLQTILLSDLV